MQIYFTIIGESLHNHKKDRSNLKISFKYYLIYKTVAGKEPE